jgi:predicted ABC-type sugar transport system permease subunit
MGGDVIEARRPQQRWEGPIVNQCFAAIILGGTGQVGGATIMDGRETGAVVRENAAMKKLGMQLTVDLP